MTFCISITVPCFSLLMTHLRCLGTMSKTVYLLIKEAGGLMNKNVLKSTLGRHERTISRHLDKIIKIGLMTGDHLCPSDTVMQYVLVPDDLIIERIIAGDLS